MRKFLMITTAVYGLSLFAPAISQAQTCKQAPDCVDMGYDKSVDDCAGKKMLKCPFNTNFVSCEDGDGGDVLNSSINLLRWDLAEEIGSDDIRVSCNECASGSEPTNKCKNQFVFPEDGCIYSGIGSSDGYVRYSSYGNITINGKNLNLYLPRENFPICLYKGDILKVDGCFGWDNKVGISTDNYRDYSTIITFVPYDKCFGYKLGPQPPNVCTYSSCNLSGLTLYKVENCDCSSFYKTTNKNKCVTEGGFSCPTDETLCSVDTCLGYYECGGTWQYCTGTTCSEKYCSVECVADYFPNSCSSESICNNKGGVYRKGYCSVSCD